MVTIKYSGDELWNRIEASVEQVRERMRRVAVALDDAAIPYAVVDGNAVQQWVIQVDPGAVRNTRDVDIVLNREDLPDAITALEQHGFHFRHAAGVSMFLDGLDARASDAVHVVFAGEKVKVNYQELVPDVGEQFIERIDGIRTLPLTELVRMKLTSFRRKDQVHVLDMIQVGIIDRRGCRNTKANCESDYWNFSTIPKAKHSAHHRHPASTSIMARENAGKSPGRRLLTLWPSTTTSASSKIAPALTRSSLMPGDPVQRTPLSTPAEIGIQPP